MDEQTEIVEENAQPLERGSSHLPLWAKSIIALVVLTFISGTVAIGSLVYSGANIVKHATEPAHIARVMKAVAEIPQLPEGFVYNMAVEVLNLNMVTISHSADKTVFMLGAMSVANQRLDDPKELIDQMAQYGIPGLTNGFQAQEQGEETVAGKKMIYVAGPSADSEGDDVSGFIGCILEKEKKRMTLLYGCSPAKSFNMKAARELLGSIKNL